MPCLPRICTDLGRDQDKHQEGRISIADTHVGSARVIVIETGLGLGVRALDQPVTNEMIHQMRCIPTIIQRRARLDGYRATWDCSIGWATRSR